MNYTKTDTIVLEVEHIPAEGDVEEDFCIGVMSIAAEDIRGFMQALNEYTTTDFLGLCCGLDLQKVRWGTTIVTGHLWWETPTSYGEDADVGFEIESMEKEE